MRNIFSMRAVIIFFSCSEDVEPEISKDELVLFTTTFQTQPFEVVTELPTGNGDTYFKTEYRSLVVRFKDAGRMERFTVDADNKMIGAVSHGSYKLEYPRIYDISMFEDKETVVLKTALNTLRVELDELIFSSQ